MPPGVPCSLALPGNATEALACPDKMAAFKALEERSCLDPNSPVATEVEQVWQSRDSLPADAAARDHWIQAFMAKCIVDASHLPRRPAPLKASAVAYLRNALRDSSPAVVGAAMTGIASVLEKEDIDPIVRAGSRESTLAVAAVASLSTSCSLEAKAGIASIRAAYTGTPRAAEIDRFVEQTKDVCTFKDHPGIPTLGRQTIPSPPPRQDDPPSAAQLRVTLASADPKSAHQPLLDARCTPANADVVAEMRRAWDERGSPRASATVQDPLIQAVIARCLIQADYPANSANAEIVDAAGLLRRAIRSDDIMTMLVSVEGLAIVGADEDVQPIVDVVRRVPSSLNGVVRFLGYQCGASNLKTIAAIRAEESGQARRDQLDAVYSRIAPVREQRCGKGK